MMDHVGIKMTTVHFTSFLIYFLWNDTCLLKMKVVRIKMAFVEFISRRASSLDSACPHEFLFYLREAEIYMNSSCPS